MHAMAASLGLNPEAIFSSFSSPFMSDYAPPMSFQAGNNAVDDAAVFSAELDDLYRFEYSPAAAAPVFASAGGGAGDDRNDDRSMYVYMRTVNLISSLKCGTVLVGGLVLMLLCFGDLIRAGGVRVETRRDREAMEGSGSGRGQRWRSWTTDSNGGSTEKRLSRTAQIQGKN